MTDKAQTLGQLELEVLKIVWDKQGCTVPEAAEVLAMQKGYARTTILTVIQRLYKKDFLKRKKEGGVFHYYPTQKKTTVLGNLTKQFVQNIFEGSHTSLVQHMTEADVSTEELTKIRKIIDKAIAAEGDKK
ncbi:MAG: BlaI/MecI/CopY family transcriptional regulator [Anaerohalosphaera sp.]|nr:BlaI/MecI/CopY family transcriptional regulator [Anaerohalosphaera sp.]